VRRYNRDMKRWLAVAALGAVFVAAGAYAQRGGGGHGGFGGHASMRGARPSGSFHGGGFGHPGFGHPGFGRPGFGFGRGPFFGNRFHHHGFYPWGWGWGYGYPWAYADLGWYDNSYDSYYPNEQYYPGDDASVSYFQNRASRQQAEIDRLEDEVARLREEREARQQTNQKPELKPQPTELVFRDKRTEEIQNYAIVGQALWVLSAERARKIPLADLDVAATQKANEDRGVEFAIPK